MPLKTILFLSAFAVCCAVALFAPIYGILGYVAHYCLGPERQWWAAPVSAWGVRYSYTLAIATAVSIAIHHGRLRYGTPLLTFHEKLLLAFLGAVWLSTLVGRPSDVVYTTVDHPALKITKVFIFVLMLTHVVTTAKHFDLLMWVLVLGALVLGIQAYTTPWSAFTRGRIETVGGPDFAESNFLGACLGALLPLVGVQFLRSGWIGKLVCLASGVFATNAIVLTRSRGAAVGIACGVLGAMVLAPRKHRTVIIVGLLIAAIGAYALMDPAFLGRVSTISRAEDERDVAAQSRIAIWTASVRMIEDYPWGVGAANFGQAIGRYFPIAGADAHSTFVRCVCELGIQGAAVFLLVIASALYSLWRLPRKMEGLPDNEREGVTYAAYGLAISLIVMLVSGLTISLLYTEALWWLLAMPVCLERVLANALEDARQTVPVPRFSAAGRSSSRPVPVPRKTAT